MTICCSDHPSKLLHDFNIEEKVLDDFIIEEEVLDHFIEEKHIYSNYLNDKHKPRIPCQDLDGLISEEKYLNNYHIYHKKKDKAKCSCKNLDNLDDLIIEEKDLYNDQIYYNEKDKLRIPCQYLNLCSTNCIDFLGNGIGVQTSFNKQIIQRRIQNQCRASSGRYMDNLSSVIVSSNFLNFKKKPITIQILKDFTPRWVKSNGIGTNVWGESLYLRNQSDQLLPSNSLVLPKNLNINTPSKGNSVKSTLTSNIPGGSTPGGFGVDVKHGSYQRYLDKKKGLILTKGRPSTEKSLLWYRENPLSANCSVNRPQTCGYRKKINSSGINNQPFKFSLVSVNSKLCETC